MIRSLIIRSPFARVAHVQSLLPKRNFSTPNSRLRADLVQDLYLKEIRNYRAPSLKASDAEGHVQKFSAPKAPQSPDEGDIAQGLKDYENQQVELEGQTASGGTGVQEESWFEEEDDEDGNPQH